MVRWRINKSNEALSRGSVISGAEATEYSLHEGLQAARNLIEMLEVLSHQGAVVLTNMTLRRGKRTLHLDAPEYFKIAFSATESALATAAPKAARSVRERY